MTAAEPGDLAVASLPQRRALSTKAGSHAHTPSILFSQLLQHLSLVLVGDQRYRSFEGLFCARTVAQRDQDLSVQDVQPPIGLPCELDGSLDVGECPGGSAFLGTIALREGSSQSGA
jgi:hypothetical protein